MTATIIGSRSLAAKGGIKDPSISTPLAGPETKERRKRNCTKKTRTGCLTCKKRRIRCDEHKPQCWNCLKSKERICQGYVGLKEEDGENAFQIHLETYDGKPTKLISSSSSSRVSGSSANTSTSTTPTDLSLPRLSKWSHNTQPTLPSDGSHVEEPSYFVPVPYNQPRNPYTGVGFAAVTSPSLEDENSFRPPPMQSPNYLNHKSFIDAKNNKHMTNGSAASSQPLQGPARPPSMSSARSDSHSEAAPPAVNNHPFSLIRNPNSEPFMGDPQSAKSFGFYMSHSGVAMGARSSNLFFLYTIPQVAGQYDYVRYALLATSLVDESVDDTYTKGALHGPGIECRDVEARRLSFEMYGRSVRSLCDAHAEVHATYRDSDNALAATLITCILLFGFENWLWNVQNAGRHIEGARALIQRYEKSAAGQERRSGLLHDQVLIMVRSAVKYHEDSLQLRMPATRTFDLEGPTWAPDQDLVVS